MKRALKKLRRKAQKYYDSLTEEMGILDENFQPCWIHTGHFGNQRGLWGTNGLAGDLSNLRGDANGIYGHCTDLGGDLDDCELSDEDRRDGVSILDLITQRPQKAPGYYTKPSVADCHNRTTKLRKWQDLVAKEKNNTTN